jgi:hypothetical protein
VFHQAFDHVCGQLPKQVRQPVLHVQLPLSLHTQQAAAATRQPGSAVQTGPLGAIKQSKWQKTIKESIPLVNTTIPHHPEKESKQSKYR